MNQETGLTMKTADFPDLLKYRGQDIVTTDGTTLLGADDKAGVAEIMTMAEYLLAHPEIPHGTIRIGFTPDEEWDTAPIYLMWPASPQMPPIR